MLLLLEDGLLPSSLWASPPPLQLRGTPRPPEENGAGVLGYVAEVVTAHEEDDDEGAVTTTTTSAGVPVPARESVERPLYSTKIV